MQIQIGDRAVGPACPALLIAEIAQAHDGSVGMAHAYIDAVADARADAVKFQTHIAAEESTLDEPFRVKFSLQDETRYAYWKRMEFTPEQWAGLAEHTRARGLIFLSSAFSGAALDLLVGLGVPAWKLGSGEFGSAELLAAMIRTGKPILYSTGMSTWQEIDIVVKELGAKNHPFALLQCTSQYPTSVEAVGLNVIDELRTRYGCPVGLSDHTGKVFAPLAALARRADIVEVHVTFDKKMFGPDTTSSLSIAELAMVADARDEFRAMDAHPVDKDRKAVELDEVRGLFTKSVAPATFLRAGELLFEAMLVPRKPGTGIPYSRRHELVGRRLATDVSPDRLLRWENLEKNEA